METTQPGKRKWWVEQIFALPTTLFFSGLFKDVGTLKNLWGQPYPYLKQIDIPLGCALTVTTGIVWFVFILARRKAYTPVRFLMGLHLVFVGGGIAAFIWML